LADDLQKYLDTVSQGKEKVIASVKEGKKYYAIISQVGRTDYGDLFAVYELRKKGQWVCSYKNDFLELKPWKIEKADIDGDGEQEILTAVRKSTHFDQTEKNRLFVFNFTEGALVKKWTGSDIAGTWEDFIVGDLLPIQGNELIFVEDTKSGEEKISIYYWFDFGFLRLAESENYQDITALSILDENRIQITYKNEFKTKTILTVEAGKIVEEK